LLAGVAIYLCSNHMIKLLDTWLLACVFIMIFRYEATRRPIPCPPQKKTPGGVERTVPYQVVYTYLRFLFARICPRYISVYKDVR
jgi:hypothetical protein